MPIEILINGTQEEVRIALLLNHQLQEISIERYSQQSIVGNIYVGRVTRLAPGMQAAFIDIGLERSVFLHLTDLLEYTQGTVELSDLLSVGQKILVQVYKEAFGTKGARVTTKFSIPSRYLVFTPGLSQVNISKKIVDPVERERLQQLVSLHPQGGYIVRTIAQGRTAAEISADQVFLDKIWKEIILQREKAEVGARLYAELPLALRLLRDLIPAEIEKIRVDKGDIAQQMQQFAQQFIPELVDKIEFYQDKLPIFNLYSLDEEINKLLMRKVYLRSGGDLVIDQTEAMTTIDVNTGSFLGQGKPSQTIFRTNLEAVDAIARQVRLRNLGGIIIIDFIDMTEKEQRAQIIKALISATAKDPARVEVSELSQLGLVQMTRKRIRESLQQVLCEQCPTCHRRGMIKTIQTIGYDIFRAIQLSDALQTFRGFKIIAAEEVVDYLKNVAVEDLKELELQLGKPIELQVELSYVREQYRILPGDFH